MAGQTEQTARAAPTLAELVGRYGRRISSAVFAQHKGSSVVSALGIWMLLAASASAASGAERAAVEEALGCPTDEASFHLRRLLDRPPPALRTAMALWVRGEDLTSALVRWSAALPRGVELGPVPTQAEADRWASEHTGGLIETFPLTLDDMVRLVLASAVAADVTWEQPLDVGSADRLLRRSSPWHGRVRRVLYEYGQGPVTMLAETESAGTVALHATLGADDLALFSVAADPDAPRHDVLDAAYELARLCRADGMGAVQASLFDQPLGDGHSWTITERTTPAAHDEREERVTGTQLVAWTIDAQLDLLADAFGVLPAARTLLALIGPDPRGDEIGAKQSTIASYSATGFQAASLSAMAVRATGRRSPDRLTNTCVTREAVLRFDHPHAVIAVAGTASDFRYSRAGHTDDYCLPLFTAWVDTPVEADEDAAD